IFQPQAQAMFSQQHHYNGHQSYQNQGQSMFASQQYAHQHHQPQASGIFIQNNHNEQVIGAAQGVQGNGSLFSQPHHYGQGQQAQVQGIHGQDGQQHLVYQAAPSLFMGSASTNLSPFMGSVLLQV